MVKTAVIPAAGMGTRFLPYTKSIPKEMLPLMNKPILHVIIDCLQAVGIEEVIIVVNESKQVIIDYFRRDEAYEALLAQKNKDAFEAYNRFFASLPRIRFVNQHTPAGLAEAILIAEGSVGNNPFLVVLGDVIVSNGPSQLQRLINHYERTGKASIGLYQIEPERIHTVGMAECLSYPTSSNEKFVDILRVIEKPRAADTLSRLAIAGSYVFDPSVFGLLKDQALEQQHSDKERDLSYALNMLAGNGKLAGLIYEDTVYDTGTPIGWHILNEAIFTGKVRLEKGEHICE